MLHLVVNNKTKKLYNVLYADVINCTNVMDGEEMVLYTDGEKLFVRDKKEFGEKFSPIKIEPKEE